MAGVASGAAAHDTFPKLLLRNAKTFATRPAMREKDLGIWQTWTWADVLEEVRALSVGLHELGLKRGDRLAIVGDNRPRLYFSMCAAQALGAIPVPVYQDSVAEEMGYVLEHAGVTFAMVENQEQVDKLLGIPRELQGHLEASSMTMRAGCEYDHAKGLQSYVSVQELGRAVMARDGSAQQAWLDEIAKGNGEDTSIMLYTSGTTGRPKGVVLSQNACMWAARTANRFDNLTEREETIAYLPLAWVGDFIFSYATVLRRRLLRLCPESEETVMPISAKSGRPTTSRRRASSRTC
jgi:long-chain acyl-CoA synthetase